MKLVADYLRKAIVMASLLMSFFILIPPVPSELADVSEIPIVSASSIISVALFCFSVLLMKGKKVFWKRFLGSKIIFTVCLFTGITYTTKMFFFASLLIIYVSSNILK